MNDNDRRDIAVIGSMKFLLPSVVIPKNGKLIDWIIVYGLDPQLLAGLWIFSCMHNFIVVVVLSYQKRGQLKQIMTFNHPENIVIMMIIHTVTRGYLV